MGEHKSVPFEIPARHSVSTRFSIQGTVTGVLMEAGTAKITVDGSGYRLEQVITSAPLALVGS